MQKIEELQGISKTAGLSLKQAEELAVKYSISLLQLESIALEQGIMPSRFMRNTLTCDEQLKVFQSKVSIIGCGGLGGLTADLLARIGVGNLHLVDPDCFEEHNLNRQHFCTLDALGQPKARVVSSQLLQINPALHCTYSQDFFNDSDVKKAEVVIDCLDSVAARKELDSLCRKYGQPLVHGAVNRWYSQLGISTNKNRLISTLYTNRRKNDIKAGKILAPVVSMTASLQAAETVKLLLGYPSELENSLLNCDLLTPEFQKTEM